MEERHRGPGEAPNLGEPTEPRAAASVVLLRRGGEHGDRALEVLLLKRTQKAKFMPGVWVFPGGAVDGGDGAGAAGHRACAVRELAEEAGIELAPSEELVLFSRWITPEVISTRFDAWFFLALAPPHTPPRPDGVEPWTPAGSSPGRHSRRRREVRWRSPFRRSASFESLQRFGNVEEAIEAPPRRRGRADPAEGPRQRRGSPGRPSGRPRLPGGLELGAREGLQAGVPGTRADRCGCRSLPSPPAAA